MIWNLFEFIFCLTESFFLYVFYSSFLGKRFSKITYIIGGFIIAAADFSLTYTAFDSVYKTVIGIILFFAYSLLFDKAYLKGLLLALMYYSIICIADGFCLSLLSLHSTANVMEKILRHSNTRFAYCCFSALVKFLIINVLSLFSSSKDSKIPLKHWLGLIFISGGVTWTTDMVLSVMLHEKIRVESYSVLFTVAVVLLAVNIMIFHFYVSLGSYFSTKRELDKVKLLRETEYSNYKLAEQRYLKQKRLSHDMKNHLILLKGLISSENYREAENYLKQIYADNIADFDIITGNRTADIVLSVKKHKAAESGIEICTEGKISADINIAEEDLCSLIGNLIDNAVEATEKTTAGKKIEVFLSEKGAYLFIKMTNPYMQKPEINEEAGFFYKSSKQGDHGFGLSIVKSIVKKYDGNMLCEAENGKFTVSVFVRKFI